MIESERHIHLFDYEKNPFQLDQRNLFYQEKYHFLLRWKEKKTLANPGLVYIVFR